MALGVGLWGGWDRGELRGWVGLWGAEGWVGLRGGWSRGVGGAVFGHVRVGPPGEKMTGGGRRGDCSHS